MNTNSFTESVVEEAALAWLEALGYSIANGPEIGCGQPGAERTDWGQVFLELRLRQALARLNPKVPASALEEAFRRLTRPDSPSLVGGNRSMHRLLVEGVTVEYPRPDGSLGGDIVGVIDFDKPDNNDFLAVNQFTVVENKHERRPDVVLFVNGLPLAVIELKNAADENATIWTAFNQLQTYKAEIPSLFTWNAALVVSDGVQARVGTLTADRERFMPWRTIEGEELAPTAMPELQVVLEGVFEKTRFLELVRHFIVFEDEGGGKLVKKMAGYHQFHAVNLALAATVKATGAGGDRRVGRGVAHAGVGQEPDDGLLRRARDPRTGDGEPDARRPHRPQRPGRPALRHVRPLQGSAPPDAGAGRQPRATARLAQDRFRGRGLHHHPEVLPRPRTRRSFPLLSERRNIVVIADEAHRSQYDFIDGFARTHARRPARASFIGFTGTPIEKADANTRAVFGDYISVYDIQRAVEDGATVPIYYESRLAKLQLDDRKKPKLDAEFEEATEGEETDAQGEAQDEVGGAGGAGRRRRSGWRWSPPTS